MVIVLALQHRGTHTILRVLIRRGVARVLDISIAVQDALNTNGHGACGPHDDGRRLSILVLEAQMLLGGTGPRLLRHEGVLDYSALTQDVLITVYVLVWHRVYLLFRGVCLAHVCTIVHLVVAVELHRLVVWHLFDATVEVLVILVDLERKLFGLSLIWEIRLEGLEGTLESVTNAVVECDVIALLLVH